MWQKKESCIQQGTKFSATFFAMGDIMNEVVFHSLVNKIYEQSSGLTAVDALLCNHICF